jgi:hypothetical protein
VWLGSSENGIGLVFDGTATAKTALFIALDEVLPKSLLFEPTAELL